MALNQVPQPGQDLQPTQAPILANFATINAAFLVDHVEYALANQGLHNKITMPIQAIAPATLAGQTGLYSANGIYGTPALFFKPQNSPAGTAGIDFTTCTNAVNGWCQLPGGTIFAWGNALIIVPTTIINCDALFTNAILNVQLTIINPSHVVASYQQFVGVNNVDNAGAHRRFSPNATNLPGGAFPFRFYWFAVGN
jgi:hypothetical protein